MKNTYVSDYWNKGIKGHENYDFVDINVSEDNLLFIDPILIEITKGEWFYKAKEIIVSYFDNLYKAYRENDIIKKKELLSHAGEQNGPRLGYGRGDNGKGNTESGLIEIFKPLENLIKQILTMNKVEDLPLLIPNFGEDGLSDLLINILHAHLNDFTLQQMRKYGIESNAIIEFWSWNKENICWEKTKRSSYCINGQELLIVPKQIVRKKYLFSTDQYFKRIILERIRDEGGYMDEGGKTIPKSEILKSKRFSGEHWEYKESIEYTLKNNDSLNEYHKKLPVFYAENGAGMSDAELDEFIYR